MAVDPKDMKPLQVQVNVIGLPEVQEFLSAMADLVAAAHRYLEEPRGRERRKDLQAALAKVEVLGLQPELPPYTDNWQES